jgi:hypothetical protein
MKIECSICFHLTNINEGWCEWCDSEIVNTDFLVDYDEYPYMFIANYASPCSKAGESGSKLDWVGSIPTGRAKK